MRRHPRCSEIYLHKAGYRTLEAPNSETARNLIRQASPDLILLDLMRASGINTVLDLVKYSKRASDQKYTNCEVDCKSAGRDIAGLRWVRKIT